MKEYHILLKAFSSSNEMIMWFLIFSLFIWWITLIDFHMLNHPASLDEVDLIMVDDVSDVFLDSI